MHTSLARLLPLSAFGTPPKGDSLFGQLCWAARHRFGEDRLTEWLGGYANGAPFLVVSDALPAGHLPRPALPGHWFDEIDSADRKAVKKRRWLPLDGLANRSPPGCVTVWATPSWLKTRPASTRQVTSRPVSWKAIRSRTTA